MKQTLLFFLAALLCSTGLWAQSGTCGNGLTWELADSTLTISGTGAMEDYTSSSAVPWHGNRQAIKTVVIADGVTSIGNNAFNGCSALEQATMGGGIESIGNSAFSGCTALAKADIPDGVSTIGRYSFFGCSALAEATIGSGVATIGEYAFSGCSALKQVVIPDNVTTIGDGAFNGCSSILRVTIGSSVASIGNYAFAGCSKIIKLTTLATTPPAIQSNTFEGVQNVLEISLPEDTETAYKVNQYWKALMEISGTCGSLEWTLSSTDGTLTISGVGEIQNYSTDSPAPWSSYRSKIKKVVFGNDITRIGERAFYGCYAITQMTIGSGVTSIGYYAFYGCPQLSKLTVLATTPPTLNYNSFEKISVADFEITVPEGTEESYKADEDWGELFMDRSGTCGENLTWTLALADGTLTISGTGVMTDYDAPWYEYSSVIKKVIIENGVTSIGNYAFNNCRALTQVSIGSGVTTIGEQAFYNCNALTQVEIPNSVTSIGDWAFLWCNALTQVEIPNSVTSIGYSAFSACRALTQVSIGSGVTSIGNQAFDGCSALSAINVASDNAAYCSADGVLFNKDKTTLIQYPKGKTEALYSIPDDVTTIGERAFKECNALKQVEIPNSVTSIGDGAFYWCHALTQVSIGSGVTSIGNSAFGDCRALTQVDIPSSVESIGDGAFNYCDTLSAINVASDNTAYCSADGVLFNKDKTTLIQYPTGKTEALYSIPDGVTTIGESAFSSCDALTRVDIPSSVDSIGNWAFSYCDQLSKLTVLATTPPAILSSTFVGLNHANFEITVPEGTEDAYKADEYWKELFGEISGTCGENLTWTLALADSTLTISGTGEMEQFNRSPWYSDRSAIKTVIIEDGVTSIGNYAFYNCRALTQVSIGNGVTTIGESAFNNCYALTQMDIPNSVTSIGERAFSSCRALTQVSIGSGVTSIEYSAFRNCDQLGKLTVLATTPPAIQSGTFEGLNPNRSLEIL